MPERRTTLNLSRNRGNGIHSRGSAKTKSKLGLSVLGFLLSREDKSRARQIE